MNRSAEAVEPRGVIGLFFEALSALVLMSDEQRIAVADGLRRMAAFADPRKGNDQ